MELAIARKEEVGQKWQPLPGHAVQVRGRAAAVLAVETPPGAAGSLVEVVYTDGAEPARERLLWDLECVCGSGPEDGAPLRIGPPARLVPFRSAVRASRWEVPGGGVLAPGLPLAPLAAAARFEEHQMVPLVKALSMPRVRLLLADDVGLGKTVEAGLIAAELVLRRRVRRILVLCPPALRRQWQQEMEARFGLEFVLLDRAEAGRLGGAEVAFATLPRIIVSSHWLARSDTLAAFRRAAASEGNGGSRIDLLVVDEAHHFLPKPRGGDSDLVAMLKEVVPWSEHRLFLSATPHDGFRTSFTGLLEILDPLSFRRTSNPTAAERQRMREVVIRRLKRELPAAPGRFPARRVTAWPVELSPGEEKLFLAMREATGFLRRCGRGRKQCATFLAEVLVKRLLSSVAAFASSFSAFSEGLSLGAGEASGPVPCDGEPATAGTPESVAKTNVQRSRWPETVDQGLVPDFDRESPWLEAAAGLGVFLSRHHPSAVERFAAVSAALAEIARPDGTLADARLERLSDWIEAYLCRCGAWVPCEKVVVFSTFVATLEAIRRHLSTRWPEAGETLGYLTGATGEAERDRVLARFNDPASCLRVLVTTDVAAEGLNLQHAARYVFHHDIPWNPAVLEQRVGRLDRIGQQRDVRSFHFVSPQSQEMRLLSRVLRKAEAMELDLGRVGDLIEERVRKVVAGTGPARRLFPPPPPAETRPPVCNERLVPGLAEALAAAAARSHLLPCDVSEAFAEALSFDGARLVEGGRSNTFRIDGAGGVVPQRLSGGADLLFDRETLSDINDLHTLEGRVGGSGAMLVHPGTPLFSWMCARLARLRQGTLLWTAPAQEPPGGGDAAVLLFLTLWAENQLREPVAGACDLLLLDVSGRKDAWEPGLVRTGDDGEIRDIADQVLAVGPEGLSAGFEQGLALPVLSAVLPHLPRLVERRRRELAAMLRRSLADAHREAARSLSRSCRQREREILQAAGPASRRRLEERMRRLETDLTRRGFLFEELAVGTRRFRDETRTELAAQGQRSDELARAMQREERLLAERLPLRYTLAWPPSLRLDALAVLLRQGEAR